MSQLLLELYSEEIPSLMQRAAANHYQEVFANFCHKNKVQFSKIEAFGGPCRITLLAEGLELNLQEQKIRGPKVESEDVVLTGFCKKNQVGLQDLEITQENGINYYWLSRKVSQNLNTLLLEQLPKIISSYVWPKSMRWGDHEINWIRPLKNILCVLDSQILPIQYFYLTANNLTFGHKFFHNSAITISCFDDYISKLYDAKVIVCDKKRQEIITNQLQNICKFEQIELNVDSGLLEEVNGLVEWPTVLVGNIPENFMHLAQELLISCLRVHQKYFTCNQGATLANKFLFVSNNPDNTANNTIIEGNERVLNARLSDALYFYQEDLKIPLEARLTSLDKLIFHTKLGSMKAKALRLEKLSQRLMPQEKELHLAAKLCKCDLVSQVVLEFPELQGIISKYYALNDGLSEQIAASIAGHYAPIGANSLLPSGFASYLSLVDKFDNAVSLMLAGEKATSSKDPYAIRRSVISVLRIILANNLSIDLEELINYQIQLIQASPSEQDINYIREFFLERLKHLLCQQYDINLVACTITNNLKNILATKDLLQNLAEFQNTVNWTILLQNYKRVVNILGKESNFIEIDPALLNTTFETELYSKLEHTQNSLQSLEFLPDRLNQLLLLNKPIENFFDNVLVKAEDEQISKRRLSLTHKLKIIFESVLDFSRFIAN